MKYTPPTALGPGDPDDGEQGRQQRGLAIAALANIREDKFGYKVPSQSRSGSYLVNLEYGAYCTCPDFEERQQPCKHVYAVQITLEREERPDGTEVEAKTITIQYGQHWPSYNAAQENEGRHFDQLLRALCDTIPQPPREPRAPGRPKLPLADVVYGLGLKVYEGKSTRRSMSRLRRAEDDGLMDVVPSKSSVINYLSYPSLTPLIRELIQESSLPLRSIETDFAVDSSGFASTSNNRWFDYKHGETKKKVKWAKLHLMCGVRTNIVTAADCTASESADVRFYEQFVRTTAENFTLGDVTADGAYLSHNNLRVVDELGGRPLTPFREKSRARPKSGKRDEVWEKMYHYFTLHHDDFLRHYHKRSNVETTFYMIKSTLGGETLLSKSGPAQVNEVLMRVLCHNICVNIKAMYQLGISPDFPTQGIFGQESVLDQESLSA